MTEQEYVEHLRKCAATYIANLGNDKTLDVFAGAVSAWHNAKTSMSPWTMVAICDAWLEKKKNTIKTEKEEETC